MISGFRMSSSLNIAKHILLKRESAILSSYWIRVEDWYSPFKKYEIPVEVVDASMEHNLQSIFMSDHAYTICRTMA